MLEVCVDTPDGADQAVAGGCDRIELCAGLALGGLTPSGALMETAARLPVPVIALIRPRAGTFQASPAELAQMRREIALARQAGLAGVAIGVLDANGRLDTAALTPLIAAARGLQIVLHRAFDLTPDPEAALESAIALGFHRILTSGGAVSAPEGAAQLAALVRRAGDRIEIMPGAGITAANAAALLERTGAGSLHASCAGPVIPADPQRAARESALGFAPAAGMRATQRALVQALRTAMTAKGSRT
ncbi:copper homeostasis protein CutC [Pseudooceanicola sp. CBS1P-1]|uniref:PF03932 family protein CutC n=2 Tax=Paracoccaceae TaxID=31989 RepID=A0A6L7G4P8_9RHOB|nr:copper homeostasis protein CutC [Pseudooceanicola endophyticus]MXN18497.1 copper homeostasis protein CutC [Pseudooceanicola albus]